MIVIIIFTLEISIQSCTLIYLNDAGKLWKRLNLRHSVMCTPTMTWSAYLRERSLFVMLYVSQELFLHESLINLFRSRGAVLPYRMPE